VNEIPQPQVEAKFLSGIKINLFSNIPLSKSSKIKSIVVPNKNNSETGSINTLILFFLITVGNIFDLVL